MNTSPSEDRSGLLTYTAREKNKIMDLITTEAESIIPQAEVMRILRLHRDHFLKNPISVFEHEVAQIVARLTTEMALIDLGCWTGVLGHQVLQKVTPKEYVGIDGGLWYVDVAREILPPTAKFRSFYIVPDSAADINRVTKIYFTPHDPLNTSGFYTRRVYQQKELAAMPAGKTIRPVDFAFWIRDNFNVAEVYLKTDIEGVDQELVQALCKYDILPKVIHFEMLEKFMPYWPATRELLQAQYDFVDMPTRSNCTGIIVAVRKNSGLTPSTMIWDKTTKVITTYE